MNRVPIGHSQKSNYLNSKVFASVVLASNDEGSSLIDKVLGKIVQLYKGHTLFWIA